MKYGIYDTKDNCWMGNDKGPLLYDDEMMAQIAARLLDVQLKWPAGRCRGLPFERGKLTLKDKKKTFMSPEVALEKLENGEVL